MGELAAIILGVALVCTIGALLERAGGALGFLGGLMVLGSGLAAGAFAGLILAFVVTPGACVAVLCPSCYREPDASAVRFAGLVYFSVLGLAAGLLPGRLLSLGFGLGCLVAATASMSYWAHFDAGATVLPGLAVALLLWAIRRELGRRVAAGPAGPDLPATDAEPHDFWDGDHWRPLPHG